MRGVIAGIVPDGTYGQIAAEDGQRYSYWTTEVRNGPVKAGQTVEFQMWEGQPVDIFGVNNPQPPSAAPPQRAPAPQQRNFAPAGYAPGPGTGAAAAYANIAGAGAIPSGSGYWIQLFTSPSGRISRKQFWLHGFLPILIGNIVLGWIPLLGQLISLALLWASICIGFKRFHDLGYPGWWSLVYLIPLLAGGIIFALGFYLYNFANLFWLLAEILWGVGALVGLAQLIFVYIRVGEQGPNQYGPDPLAI
jgi:uncharacterized membrane protein YhaH (DUF805 family)